VIEHVISEFRHEAEEKRYRTYVTDALMALTDSASKMFGGKHMSKRWADKYIPKDTRTADEIAMEVIQNAGLITKWQVK